MSEIRITEAQSASLQDFKDDLASEAHGMTVADAHAQNVCINCKKPPTFYSDDGRGEYQISGLCEPCFDEICAEPDEGDYCATCCPQIGEGGQTVHEPICPLETLRIRAESAESKLTALSAILMPLKALHEECQPDGDRSPADVYYARVILRDRLFDELPELLQVMEGTK